MALNFDTSLTKVLRHEGGYVNHPKDPGGATNKGVTQRVYDAFRKSKGLKTQSVRYIAQAEINEIYRKQYWDVVRGDELPSGIDYAIFDYAVNSGPKKAATDLQRSVGSAAGAADGIIGFNTIRAIQAVNDQEALLDRYVKRRQSFLRSLGTYSTFGKGWENRVRSVLIHAKTMMGAQLGLFATEPDDGLSTDDLHEIAEAGKADPAGIKVSANGEARAGAAAGVGALGAAVTDAAGQLAPYQSVTPVLQYVFIGLTIIGVGIGLYLTWKRLTQQGGE